MEQPVKTGQGVFSLPQKRYCTSDGQEEVFVEENTLNVNISRLREKLGTYEGNLYIEAVRGIGYRWAVPVKGDRI